MKSINWIGVIAAVVASQAIGFAWYGYIFAAQWTQLSGMADAGMEGGGNLTYLYGALQNLVVAVGLAWLVVKTGAGGWIGGARTGLFACVFFALATYALRFIYGDDNPGLIPIDGGYMLIQYLVSGALVAGLKVGKAAPAA
ncbi:MAG: DUF1761 domain-containing protein [Caulobacter sp.]